VASFNRYVGASRSVAPMTAERAEKGHRREKN
jgi:hypothetical protein